MTGPLVTDIEAIDAFREALRSEGILRSDAAVQRLLTAALGVAAQPEAVCQRCGRPNICWYADNDDWNTAVGTPADPHGHGLILCPVCFVWAFEARTRRAPCWHVTPGGS